VPLAIARPDLHVTLLDSNGKKARFLRHLQRTLPLANVEVVEARAEQFEPSLPFDTVISRAFGSLADFAQAAARLCAPGGRLVAMKGKLDRAELAAVPAGLDIQELCRLTVPGLAEERHAVIAQISSPK
jgi:16S rRNA (guanine527-N7)-methyltransferase